MTGQGPERSWVRASLIGLVVVTAATAGIAQSPQTQNPDLVRGRWNAVFSEGAPSLDRTPSDLLRDSIRERQTGIALDLGSGQGRNALFLAESGWTVTGVDISEVAVEQARQQATARTAAVEFVVADLDQHDFGRDRWDLIASFYMHGWHDRSPTDVARRIVDALKPGGLLVIEGFARPDVSYGFDVVQLTTSFRQLKVLRAEMVSAEAEWDRGNTRQLVRFVAEKAR